MKDVLITLQMEVMSTLGRVEENDSKLNFEELQQVSDECRVNAVVCLGQLYQRLAYSQNANLLPMQAGFSQGQYEPWSDSEFPSANELDHTVNRGGYGMPLSPPHSASSSPTPNEPQSPGIISFHLSELEISPQPGHRSMKTLRSPESLPRRRDTASMSDEARKRRTASSFGAIPSFADYPTPNGPTSPNEYNIQDTQPLFPQQSVMQPPPRNPQRESERRYREMIQADSSNGWSQAATSSSRVYEHPDDFGHPGRYPNVPRQSYASRNQHPVRFPPRQTNGEMHSPPLPHQSPSISYAVKPPSQIYDGIQLVDSTASVHQISGRPASETPSSTISRISTTRSQFLTFPSEANNYGGFCQGAWRLQVGDNKKAFAVNQRPVGMTGTLPFWRCKKCDFEGPLAGGPSKTTQSFDRRVRRTASGIQYRWAFLAKCHVQNKRIAPTNITDGSFGTFGCIFCCAEGTLVTDNMSIHSGSSGGVQLKGRKKAKDKGSQGTTAITTPFFGNVQAFMEHLEEHRAEGRQPSTALLERTKCIVGRVAEPDEEFDINLPFLTGHV